MLLTRTSLRLEPELTKTAKLLAVHRRISFQSLVNQALREYVNKQTTSPKHKITFTSHDLGTPLDNLTRDDFYDD